MPCSTQWSFHNMLSVARTFHNFDTAHKILLRWVNPIHDYFCLIS